MQLESFTRTGIDTVVIALSCGSGAAGMPKAIRRCQGLERAIVVIGAYGTPCDALDLVRAVDRASPALQYDGIEHDRGGRGARLFGGRRHPPDDRRTRS